MAATQNPCLQVMNECHVRREGEREEEVKRRGRKMKFGSRDVAHRMLRHRPQEALTPSLYHLWLRDVCVCVCARVYRNVCILCV